jgi:hypothetical protein
VRLEYGSGAASVYWRPASQLGFAATAPASPGPGGCNRTRSWSFSALSRTRAFQLLTAQLRVEVKEKCASEIAWITAERTR